MEISAKPQMASRFHPQRYFENQQGEKIPAPESFKSKWTSEARKTRGATPILFPHLWFLPVWLQSLLPSYGQQLGTCCLL